MSLVGRLAFVTGAGSGIGRATCQCLAREGALVVAADKNVKNVQETVDLLSSKNSDQKHLPIAISVEDSKNVKESLDTVLKTFSKPPSIIVNSAGITRDNFLTKLSEADFEEVLDINLKGTFLVIQTFVKAMVEYKIQNGSIINIGSIAGKYGNIGQTNYCASKAGVEMVSKVASKEFGRMGIRVNTVLPGMIETPMFATVPDKIKTKLAASIPLARLGKPEEVAELITFLASEKSSYINGASIDITGGF